MTARIEKIPQKHNKIERYRCDGSGDEKFILDDLGRWVEYLDIKEILDELDQAKSEIAEWEMADSAHVKLLEDCGINCPDGVSDDGILALINKYDELIDTKAGAWEWNPRRERALSLLRKNKLFIVVAVDEPYFKKVYEIIKANAIRANRWELGDDIEMEKALHEWKEISPKYRRRRRRK